MSKKNKASPAPAAAEGDGTDTPSVQIVTVAFAAGARKSDHARALIRANLSNLQGENAEAVRGAVVSQLVTDTSMGRALARTYIKENIQRVLKADKKAAEAAAAEPTQS